MPLRAGATVEAAQQIGIGHLPGLVGFTVLALTENRLEAELTIRPDLLAPNGYLHAATVIALADTACGYGCRSHLPEGATGFTTIELKSNFLGTATEGVIHCVATPAHMGGTTQVWDANVTRRSDGRTIALFRCTQMILYPKR
ncbi:MAG TPA: PaaI family thioesterase [Casimicrobiaceae bacterium]|nr:PaaI family thioesterase [Casimicrobiaceae bacterium]